MTTNELQYLSPSPLPFDSGPLSWVMLEIRESLARSKTALFEAGGRAPEDQSTALQHAKSHLHQAHGALMMLGLDGVGVITQVAEQVLDRFKAGTLKCSSDHAQTLADLYQALVEYLLALLDGAPAQPVRLFPYYRAVQEMLGAERIHPADLFYPDLSRRIAAPANAEMAASAAASTTASTTPPVDYTAYRQRFEKALLPYLKSSPAEQPAHAAALLEAVQKVAAAQQDPGPHTFWLAMQACTELVASGELTGGLYIKQLFGLINLQIRRLSQGSAAQPDGMLRDALFWIAATPDTATAAASASQTAPLLRRVFALDGLVPADYERRRYGVIDPELLQQARAGMTQARAIWAQHASTGFETTLAPSFCEVLGEVALACDALGLPALSVLLGQLSGIAQASGDASSREALAQEMASALLFAEHGLQQIQHLSGDFAAQADSLGTRLLALASGATPAEPSDWQDTLAQQMRQDDTVCALAHDMKIGLRQVERVLDDYADDPVQRAALAALDPVLQQLQDGLARCDQHAATQAAAHVRAALQALAAGTGDLDAIAYNVGALGFFVDMLAQNATAARARFAFDAEQGSFRSLPFKKMAAAQPIPLLDQPVPVPALALPAPAPAPIGSEAAVAAELLTIFIDEAGEALALLDAMLERSGAPLLGTGGESELAILRRSFDTLKGSGRMVGLHQFADAAHALERVINVWLAESRPLTDALFDLLGEAARQMHAWVSQLAEHGVVAHNADALVAAAARVQQGGPMTMPATPVTPTTPATQQGEAAHASELAPAPASAAAVASGNVIDFPIIPAPPPHDDNLRHIGELSIAVPLYNVYLHETDELVRLLTQDFGEWRHEPRRPVSAQALQAAHTLAGSSATVGFQALRELALALESTLAALLPPAPHLDQVQHDMLDFTIERMRQMLHSFAAGTMPVAQPELIAALRQLQGQLAATPPAASDAIEARLDELVAETMHDLTSPPESMLDQLFRATYAALSGSVPLSAAPQPSVMPTAKPRPAPVDDGIDDLFNAAFDQAYAEPPLQMAGPVAQPPATVELPPVPEPAPEPVPEPAPEPEPTPVRVAADADDTSLLLSTSAIFNDELDPDLLPVFLEEGADLLPQVGQTLRSWQQNPADSSQAASLLRLLHTVKGSARMAGAMRLGQHAHEMETHIESMEDVGSATPHAFEQLLAHYDDALQLFQQLQQPASAASTGETRAPAADEMPAGAKVALVRVRADILDRLVNQAGEVSISRSRLENEVATLRAQLSDFSENLSRLRRQLREVEMQAESHIASRMSIASEREFDPLEFDRFTRLQELTRMMAESVNDVASLHENMSRGVDQAGDDLVQQARLTRELQRDLMRARMVPFASITERLFQVARQSAKEVDKRVNLDIRGGAVEVDRSVLERMAAPFEHLLRNAIAHGVETRAERSAAGKSEIGELLVQVVQCGNEVVIEFSDDGAGLDLARIHAKAISHGLVQQDEQLSDAQIAELIFEPGFSTAAALTELSGRGVGMDIVQSETQALGGRIALCSEPGKGSRFTIHLPLTLAVTQVVLVVAAGKTYALPSALVEQVLDLKEAEHPNGMVTIQGQPAQLYYLPTLLGELSAPTPERPPERRSAPVLLLKNASERLALRVDAVLGNREVVVKSVGPQLAHVAGIAGATVLGSGDIVLILNPAALAQHVAHHPELTRHDGLVAAPHTPAIF